MVTAMMRAVGFHNGAFLDFELPKPVAAGRDLLVRVKAVSVNPVDVKQRAAARKDPPKEPRLFGWDAAGIVEQAGPDAKLYQTSDEVYYAGSITRPGCNSEYHLVDERIVGHKPQSLSFAESAALPLTSITAWESLFDRCGIDAHATEKNRSKSVLIIGGAGGVGSIATQIAKKVAGVSVIATASRPESIDWCKRMGADFVINHRKALKQELNKISIDAVDYILCCNSIELYISQAADIIQPQGRICSIIRPKDEQPLPLNALMYKSVGFEWELMFTRPMFQTEDMQAQHEMLDRVSQLVDQGSIRTTMRENFGELTAENLQKAHARIESGEMIGKLILTNP
jgi:zinc-binding alcohol dehydrogenase family protein